MATVCRQVVKALPHNILGRFGECVDGGRFFTNWQHHAILRERFGMKFGAVDVRAINSILVGTTSVVVVMNLDD
jgi:hypothetical protein